MAVTMNRVDDRDDNWLEWSDEDFDMYSVSIERQYNLSLEVGSNLRQAAPLFRERGAEL
jgi:hypothetical protein